MVEKDSGRRTDDEDGGVDEVDALEEGLAGRVRVLQLPGCGRSRSVKDFRDCEPVQVIAAGSCGNRIERSRFGGDEIRVSRVHARDNQNLCGTSACHQVG